MKDFKPLATIPSKANGVTAAHYGYLDKNAMDIDTRILYYRLRQEELQGEYSYSSTAAVPLPQQENDGIEITVYPNPFVDRITALIRSRIPADKVELVSMNGTVLYRQDLSADPGDQ